MRDTYIYYSYYFDNFFLFYFGYINGVYALTLILGLIKIFNRVEELKVEDSFPIFHSESLPRVTFLVAAYNEEKDIIQTIDNLLALSYRHKNILIINDGSTDGTLELLKQKYQLLPIPQYYEEILPSMAVREIYQSKLFPLITLIDKENGGKYDALNAGLNACQTTYFITCDADTLVDDQHFIALIRPLLTSKQNVGLGASVYIKNECTLHYNIILADAFHGEYFSSMQSIEYIRAFLGRQGWDYLGGNFVMSGAFSILGTQAVIQCGGFAPTVANDMEIILRLNRVLLATNTPYKISYLPDPVAWTDGPVTLKELGNQRAAWQMGLLESIWYNKILLFNPKYGKFGCFVFSFLTLGEAIEPLVEAIGYIYIILGLWLNAINVINLLLLLLIVWLFTFILTATSLLAEEITFRKFFNLRSILYLLFYSVIENLGYRQLNLIWRLRGTFDFIKKILIVEKDSKYINNCVKEAIRQGEIKW